MAAATRTLTATSAACRGARRPAAHRDFTPPSRCPRTTAWPMDWRPHRMIRRRAMKAATATMGRIPHQATQTSRPIVMMVPPGTGSAATTATARGLS